MDQAALSADTWQLGRRAIEFVLVKPSHPGNIGSAARAIAVMGFERLTVVAPRIERANEHRDAVAFAAGAERVLAACRITESLDDALADAVFSVAISAEEREFAQVPEPPEQIAARIMQVPGVLLSGPAAAAPDVAPVALVFGTERDGLTVAQAGRCQALCSIAGHPAYSSLNLSQAVQVLAYVMRQALLGRAPVSAPAPRQLHPRDMPASHQQIELMFEHLERMLIDIDFLNPAQPKRLMPRLRNLFGRTGLSVTEVDIMRGICNQVDQIHRRTRDKP